MTPRLAAAIAPGPRARATAPIVDRRSGRGWRHGLPQRLATAAAWGGTGWLLGPLTLKALLLSGLGMGLGLPLLERRFALPPGARPAAGSSRAGEAAGEPAWPGQLPRGQLAEAFGLPEVTLFRARHARICQVDHDDHGRIHSVSLPGPLLPQAHPDRDAHPVG